MNRRSFLKFGARLGVGIAGGAFVVGRSGLTIASTPSSESDDVPSAPSLLGSLFYWGVLMPMSYLQPPSIAQTRASAQQANRQAPPGVPIKYVDANRVPAQLICAPLASEKRVILYLHGGGFVAGLNDTYQIFAEMLSQVTGACVLLPDYRLAPEHPFPAALDDCLTAYRWLRQQGRAASQIVIAGDSGGGNLTLR